MSGWTLPRKRDVKRMLGFTPPCNMALTWLRLWASSSPCETVSCAHLPLPCPSSPSQLAVEPDHDIHGYLIQKLKNNSWRLSFWSPKDFSVPVWWSLFQTLSLAPTGAERKEHRDNIQFTVHFQIRLLMAVSLTSILNIHFRTPNIHFPSLGSAGNGRYNPKP